MPTSKPNPNTILFLVPEPATEQNDNHRRLPAAFAAAGWSVAAADPDSLSWRGDHLHCATGRLDQYTKIWLLGLGDRRTFLDRMQLLQRLPPTRFVTWPSALVLHHGKLQHLDQQPETHVSSDLEQLLQVVARGGDWILKPTAASFAEDVHRITTTEQARILLKEALTQRGYVLLQRYAPAIEQGEVRMLFAAGCCVGTYQRQPNRQGITNLAQGAGYQSHEPSADEVRLATELAADLLRRGVGYCAVDLAYPHLIETNIANPGGLGTLARLGAPTAAAAVAQNLIEYWATQPI